MIVDWHDHNAHNHQQQASAFFAEMAEKYGGAANVLWETFNEPMMVDWAAVLKPYHTAVVAAIRAKDPDNLIILGTTQWSQRVDQASSNQVAGTNLLTHFTFTHAATALPIERMAKRQFREVPVVCCARARPSGAVGETTGWAAMRRLCASVY